MSVLFFYTDPGSGTMLLQLLLATVAGAGFYFRSFFYRLFGLGNIVVYTTDEATATHNFTAYEHPHWIKDQIRNFSEACRQKKRWGNDNVLLHDHLG